VPSSSLDR